MIICEDIKGYETDPPIARKLHDISHKGHVHTLILSAEDMQRHRIRGKTDHGLDCAIALPRDLHLMDGAVVHLGDDMAIVVRAQPTRWVKLRAGTAATALELGYIAGNMHWKVRFDGDRLAIAQWGTERDILNRVQHLVDGGLITVETKESTGD